ALPATTRELVAKLTDGANAGALWLLAGYLLAMIVPGWIVERLYDYALRHYRSRVLDRPAPTYFARAFQLAVGLALDIGGIVIFTLAALAVFAARWLDQALQRMAVLLALLAIVVVRIAALLARFLLAPKPQARLLPFADAPAALLRGSLIALMSIFAIGLLVRSLLVATGADTPTLALVMLFSLALGLTLVLATTWALRRPVADLIRGNRPHGAVVG
ncbi:MAG: hypothetical protein ACM3SX_15540, partial [Deltaproteobacteria bacterium]